MVPLLSPAVSHLLLWLALLASILARLKFPLLLSTLCMDLTLGASQTTVCGIMAEMKAEITQTQIAANGGRLYNPT